MSASRISTGHANSTVTVATAGPGFYRLGGELRRRLKEIGAERTAS